MLKATVRLLPRPAMARAVVPARRRVAAPAAVTIAPRRSFWRVPADVRDMPSEYEHAKGKHLEEILWADAGLERWGFGKLQGPFGTQKNPVLVVSSLPERIIGCTGDGGEFEHPLVFFNAQTDGPKYMCKQCGQIFQVKSVLPATPEEEAVIAKIDQQVAEADKGNTPPRPDGSKQQPYTV